MTEESQAAGNPASPVETRLQAIFRRIKKHPLWTFTAAYLTVESWFVSPSEFIKAVRSHDTETLAITLYATIVLLIILLILWFVMLRTNRARASRRTIICITISDLVLIAGLLLGARAWFAIEPEYRPLSNALAQFNLGMEAFRRPDISFKNLRVAQVHFDQAVNLDPDFTRVWAYLSILHSRIYFLGFDSRPWRLEQALSALHQAENHNKRLGEVHLARGYYLYWGLAKDDSAEAEFERAKHKIPNNPDVYAGLGYINRRHGQWNQAIQNLRKAVVLEPQNADRYVELGHTYEDLRCYGDAERAYSDALRIAPDVNATELDLAELYMSTTGSLQPLIQATDKVSLQDDPDGEFLLAKVRRYIYERNYPAAESLLERSDQREFVHQDFIYPNSMLRGLIYTYANKKSQARTLLDSAQKQLAAAIAVDNKEPRTHASLALVDALLGDDRSAEQHAAHAFNLVNRVRPKDSLTVPIYMTVLATVYARSRNPEHAIPYLQSLLHMPRGLSPRDVQNDPIWDPVRHVARYSALMNESQPCLLGRMP